MFFAQFMFGGGRRHFRTPSWFYMESEDDDDGDYFEYNDYYVSDSEEEGYFTFNCNQHCCNKQRQKDASAFSRHVPQDPQISKKKQKKLEKRKRQRERQKERKEEKRKENKQRKQNNSKEGTTEAPHTVNQEIKTEEKKEASKSAQRLDQDKQAKDEQIKREKEKKRQEAEENRKREREAKAIVEEMLRKQKEKQEREKEKQKEKERKAAEEKDSDATDWFYEDVSKSKKARQREKKRTAAANSQGNTSYILGSRQPHEEDRSGKHESVPENPLRNTDLKSNKGTRTKAKKTVSRKSFSDKERPKGTAKLTTCSNTNSHSKFRNRFDVLDDEGDMESSFACDLTLESCSENDSERDETNSDSGSEIAKSDAMPDFAKDHEQLQHHAKGCSKQTEQKPRESYGSSTGNQSHNKPYKPKQNYSYSQRSSTDNQVKKEPSQNNGNFKAHRVFYSTRFKEERNKLDNIDSDLSDSTASSVSVKSHQNEHNYPARKKEALSSPLNDPKIKKSEGMGSVNGKSNVEKENKLQSSQSFSSANRNVSNRARPSSAQSYKVSDETYPGNKGRNVTPVSKRNRYTNRKTDEFKGNYTNKQNNRNFQTYNGNFKTTNKFSINDKEKGRFQKPNREFQAPKGNFQSPKDKFQTPNEKFQTSDEVFQKSNKKFQHPRRDSQTSNRNLQSPSGKFKSSDGKLQTPNGKFHHPSTEFQSLDGKFQTTSGKFQAPNGKYKMPSDSFQNSDANFSSDNETFQSKGGRFQPQSGIQNSYNSSRSATPPHVKQNQYWQQSSGFSSSPRYDNQKYESSHFYHDHRDGFPNSYAWSGDFQLYNQHHRNSSNPGSFNVRVIYPATSEGNEHIPTGLNNTRACQFEKHDISRGHAGSKYFSNTSGDNSDTLSSLESIDDPKFCSARRPSFDSVIDENCDGPAFRSCDNTGVNMATLTKERLGIPESMFNNDYIKNYYK